MKILFIGTVKFSYFALKNIIDSGENIVGVITSEDDKLNSDFFDLVPLCKKNNIPFLGICFGMQMAVIEFARNRLNIKNATSSEFGPSKASVVGLMSEWIKDGKKIKGTDKDLGGTMRLGS